MSAKRCSVTDCQGSGRMKRGYCERHYQQVRKYGAIQPDLTIEQRFWMRVDKSAGPDACWLWTKELNNKGYGCFWVGGEKRKVFAHRQALLLAGVDIDGKCVLHRCDNPPCVNPAHLRVGTQTDNMRDMVRKARINPIGIWVEREKPCAFCEAPFVGAGRQDYCTRECRLASRRARRVAGRSVAA